MISALEALQRLQEGNQRFVRGETSTQPLVDNEYRRELVAGQFPIAIILGCSDSRVPAELIFDMALGELFVIRVAGNIVAPSQVGSIEYAAERFGTRLVVVLGHSHCGAVAATLEQLERPRSNRSPNLNSIVTRIQPAVQTLLESPLREDPESLLHYAIRANVRASTNHLRHGSHILEQLVRSEGLQITGAEYSLETGVVNFIDGVSEHFAQD